jgi:hypothetical protein
MHSLPGQTLGQCRSDSPDGAGQDRGLIDPCPVCPAPTPGQPDICPGSPGCPACTGRMCDETIWLFSGVRTPASWRGMVRVGVHNLNGGAIQWLDKDQGGPKCPARWQASNRECEQPPRKCVVNMKQAPHVFDRRVQGGLQLLHSGVRPCSSNWPRPRATPPKFIQPTRHYRACAAADARDPVSPHQIVHFASPDH